MAWSARRSGILATDPVPLSTNGTCSANQYTERCSVCQSSDGGSGAVADIDGGSGPQPRGSGRRPAQRGDAAGRGRRGLRHLRRRCAGARHRRQGRRRAWARSTATSRRGPTSSSPSTGTRSRRAPRPARPCWRAAAHRTPRWRGGSTSSSTSWSPSTASPRRCSPTTPPSSTLHAYFLDRLVPVCAQLLDAAAEAGEIRPDWTPTSCMRGVGNLCIGAGNDPATTRAAGRTPHRGTAPAAVMRGGAGGRPNPAVVSASRASAGR